MKTSLLTVLFIFFAAALGAQDPRDTAAEIGNAQPKLLRLSGLIDGSGRIVFTRSGVRYEHRNWGRPTDLKFDGELWANLNSAPAAWRDFGGRLDLSRAYILERKGRDVIALEHTPDGFDLYLCDSPNGAAVYQVTIAIPRRP